MVMNPLHLFEGASACASLLLVLLPSLIKLQKLIRDQVMWFTKKIHGSVENLQKRPLTRKKKVSSLASPPKNFKRPNSRASNLNINPNFQIKHNNLNMRPLTESETQTLFAKLANYTGNSLKNLIAPLDNTPNADRYVFRVQQSRCYYVRLSLANLATSISRDKLLSLGTCLGI